VADPKTHPLIRFLWSVTTIPTSPTLDVRFYGSVPLAKFWPEIDKAGHAGKFADTVPSRREPEKLLWEWKTAQEGQAGFPKLARSKGRGSRNDLGAPNERSRFFKPNQFSWQNTNGWKDLNSKFCSHGGYRRLRIHRAALEQDIP